MLVAGFLAGSPARASDGPEVICWKFIANAATNLRRSHVGDNEDALQDAIIKVYDRCMDLAADPSAIKNIEGYLFRTLQNLRISSFRKHDARVIATDFFQRQEAVQTAFGNPVFDPDAAMHRWRSEHDNLGSDAPQIAARLSLPVAEALTADEIKVALLHLAGVPVETVVKNSSFQKTKVYELRQSAQAKLADLFKEYSTLWSFDAIPEILSNVLFYTLAAALIFILGIGTVQIIRDVLVDTRLDGTAADFAQESAIVQQEVKKAAKKRVKRQSAVQTSTRSNAQLL